MKEERKILAEIRALLESRQRERIGFATHYEGCAAQNIDCAAWWMLERLERLDYFRENAAPTTEIDESQPVVRPVGYVSPDEYSL